MNVGFYTARSGLLANQQGLDVVSNNISNVQTIGFKELRPSFSDLLYTSKKSLEGEVQTGHGSKLKQTDFMYEHGQLMFTNRELDFACPEDGFFAVQNANGDIEYTKNGAFYMSQNGDDWELVNAEGGKVLDYENKVVVFEKDDDGAIDSTNLMDSIGIFKFNNPYGLEPTGSNMFVQTESSGEAEADEDIIKLNGALELSTVDIAKQMVKVIELQRGFQLNSKMIQTADEIENIVNNLR